MNWNGLVLPESFFHNGDICILQGDCREVLLSVKSVGSAIVTDPPYELGFMGKSWDSKGVSFRKETWEVIRQACKSGAMLWSFGGSRTQHRIACAIEDAGWELRDTLMWVYGSGFPKSLDVSKAIDKQAKAERPVVGSKVGLPGYSLKHQGAGGVLAGQADGSLDNSEGERAITAPATPEAQLWDGYGTALKPAYEPIILAMNPVDKTFANNALKHGVAGLNIDECRVPTEDKLSIGSNKHQDGVVNFGMKDNKDAQRQSELGRFPANFLHDGSEGVLELFPTSKGSASGGNSERNSHKTEEWWGQGGGGFTTVGRSTVFHNDNGSAARFFYCAKASKSERGVANNHPTVKPLALMEYLCKLVKMPEYNLIIDPFMGSGTTLLACAELGIPCIGIDSDEQSCETATIRYLRSLND